MKVDLTSLESDTFSVSKDWVVADMFDYQAGRSAMQLLGFAREQASVRMNQLQAQRAEEARRATIELRRQADDLGYSHQETAEPIPKSNDRDSGGVLDPSDIPADVYVPAFPINNGGVKRVELQLCRCGENTLVMGFTSRALLVERLGEYQPWIMAPMGKLRSLTSKHGVSGLLIDPSDRIVSTEWTMPSIESLAKANSVRF